ncbi:MAG: hypothetical protein JWP44_2821 [Mucilaginibacter sp.]|nr:hypothetical protein [Mucilaginibacter sp.]
MKSVSLLFILSLLGTYSATVRPGSGKAVQFDISSILNARPVTTLTNGHLVTWTKGIDGGGTGDGYLTMAAALFNGDKNAHALPDNSLVPANDLHPKIQLHYSNQDSMHNQSCNMAGIADAEFKVPKAKYQEIYLALTSSEGASYLKIELIYKNGGEIKDFILPDYYKDIMVNEPSLCYLIHDLAKWGNKNQMTEPDHHNIDLLKLPVNPGRTLTGIKISKGKEGYVVLWGAAGITEK